jgi:Ser/Thr protein kinase RdoA (MazF antagonist)
MSDQNTHPYEHLSPDVIMNALESIGLEPDGGFLALNSYENRVYQVGIDESAPLIVKFYRPQRWTDDAIREEHRFSLALAAEEIPVVPPIADEQGETLHTHQGFRFSVYTRSGGRWPELENPDNLEWIGRFIGRIHLLGASRTFEHRPNLDLQSFGQEPVDYLLNNDLLPVEIANPYRRVAGQLLDAIRDVFDRTDYRPIRLHGDCHPGNILWTDQGPHFVDMDDCRNGPAIQDLWMLLSGERNEMALQLSYLREGYDTFAELNCREYALIEPLRSLRMIHYAAWLARRWDDPAFPRAFPWFNTPQYWLDHVNQLELQLQAVKAPSLPAY